MNSMSVDTGRLRTIGGELIGHASTYNSDIDKIYSYVDEVKSSWVGADSSAFTGKVEELQTAIRSLGQVLNEYGEFLNSTAQAIDSTIANNTIK